MNQRKVSGELCLHRHSRSTKGHWGFQTEAGNPAWTHLGVTSEPPTQGNRCFLGILTPGSCHTASSSAAKVDTIWPAHYVATDSPHIKCGCVSLFSSFSFHAGEKYSADYPGVYWPTHRSDETSPSPHPANARAPGCSGTSLRAGGAVWFPLFTPTSASQTKMQRKWCQMEEVRDASAHLSDWICSDTGFLTHRPANTLLLFQGCVSFGQTNLDLC